MMSFIVMWGGVWVNDECGKFYVLYIVAPGGSNEPACQSQGLHADSIKILVCDPSSDKRQI